MSLTFPKSALLSQPSLSERMQREMAASEQHAKLRSLYRKARESEKAQAEQITQAWRAEAEARTAEQQAARAREDEAIEDNAAG